MAKDASYSTDAYTVQGGEGMVFADTAVGIKFTGTVTNCISIGASETGITKLIRVGTWGNDCKIAADDEFIECLCQVSGATHSKPLARFRMGADSSTNMTTGSVIALECLAYGSSTYTLHDATAIVAHTGVKGASSLTATAKMRAAYLKVEDLDNALNMVSGSYVCPLWMEMQFNESSTFSGNVYWINFSKYGGETSTYGDAVLRFEDLSGGGWATNFIEMDNGRAPFTASGASGATNSDAMLRCSIGDVHYSIALYLE